MDGKQSPDERDGSATTICEEDEWEHADASMTSICAIKAAPHALKQPPNKPPMVFTSLRYTSHSEQGSIYVQSSSEPTIAVASEGKGSSVSTASNVPDVVDSALLSAMANPRERMILFQIEDSILKFMQSSDRSMEISPGYNSFRRLLAYRVGQRFGLSHSTFSTEPTNEAGAPERCITLFKTPASSYPRVLLIDLPADYAQEAAESAVGTPDLTSDASPPTSCEAIPGPAESTGPRRMQLMKRQPAKSGADPKGAAPNRSQATAQSSEDKERAYLQARARIFGNPAAVGSDDAAADSADPDPVVCATAAPLESSPLSKSSRTDLSGMREFLEDSGDLRATLDAFRRSEDSRAGLGGPSMSSSVGKGPHPDGTHELSATVVAAAAAALNVDMSSSEVRQTTREVEMTTHTNDKSSAAINSNGTASNDNSVAADNSKDNSVAANNSNDKSDTANSSKDKSGAANNSKDKSDVAINSNGKANNSKDKSGAASKDKSDVAVNSNGTANNSNDNSVAASNSSGAANSSKDKSGAAINTKDKSDTAAQDKNDDMSSAANVTVGGGRMDVSSPGAGVDDLDVSRERRGDRPVVVAESRLESRGSNVEATAAAAIYPRKGEQGSKNDPPAPPRSSRDRVDTASWRENKSHYRNVDAERADPEFSRTAPAATHSAPPIAPPTHKQTTSSVGGGNNNNNSLAGMMRAGPPPVGATVHFIPTPTQQGFAEGGCNMMMPMNAALSHETFYPQHLAYPTQHFPTADGQHYFHAMGPSSAASMSMVLPSQYYSLSEGGGVYPQPNSSLVAVGVPNQMYGGGMLVSPPPVAMHPFFPSGPMMHYPTPAAATAVHLQTNRSPPAAANPYLSAADLQQYSLQQQQHLPQQQQHIPQQFQPVYSSAASQLSFSAVAANQQRRSTFLNGQQQHHHHHHIGGKATDKFNQNQN